MNVNFFITKDYKNSTAFRVRENKANQTLLPQDLVGAHMTYFG